MPSLAERAFEKFSGAEGPMGRGPMGGAEEKSPAAIHGKRIREALKGGDDAALANAIKACVEDLGAYPDKTGGGDDDEEDPYGGG